jgi:hypothetical protein
VGEKKIQLHYGITVPFYKGDESVKHVALLFCILFISLSSFLIAGTTGKISGVVTDAQTGEVIIGASVVITGTSYGSPTDIYGNFTILNLPPGEYTVRTSSVGYTAMTQTQVRVVIDQTTTLNFKLIPEAVQSEEVIVVAQRPVVQKDVSSSQANITSKDIETLPVASVSAVVGLQAGIQSGLVIRGSSNADQTAFIVDGLTLRNERNNQPYSGISLSSIQDIQVQTGGFNAEYGDIRSGVVNVITKEGKLKGYSLGASVRVAPPTAKNFGPSPFNYNSYFMRPFLDPAVAFVGTGTGNDPGPWDAYTRAQYRNFIGWNAVSKQSLADNDPNNDLTPLEAQQLFLFQHRKDGTIRKPDYDVDGGFGGPVPIVSDYLGNLRFFASYRQSQSMYMIPLSTDAYRDWYGSLRVTSDIGSSMKLMASYMRGIQTGTSSNNTGNSGMMATAGDIANSMNEANYADLQMYMNDYYCPTQVNMTSYGAKFTHALSNASMYEASLNYVLFQYNTNPGRARDTSRIYLFGNSYYVDEAPFGYSTKTNEYYFGTNFTNTYGQSGSRDTSKISNLTFKFDYSTQLNRFNLIKTGVEIVSTISNTNYATVNSVNGATTTSRWNTYPYRASWYIQDKLEYQGMIANLGIRVDDSDPNGTWYDYSMFDSRLFGFASLGMDTTITRIQIKKQVMVSPRLGVAFPVTEYAKLFFNYGHFYSMPQPEDLFLVRHDPTSGSVTRLANPNNPLPKTVAYELGYEHSLMDQFLIRVAGYYKNVSNQITAGNQNLISIKGTTGLANAVNYTLSIPNSYEDIRGFEVTFTRNRGNWITGMLNFTYMARSLGRFGFNQISQSAADEATYESSHQSDLYQTKPVPSPYARAVLNFFTPSDFLEKDVHIGGVGLLNDWLANVTASWTSGTWDTWLGSRNTPTSAFPDILYNVQWRDTYSANVRVSKNFRIGKVDVEFFADFNNILNIKNFSGYGFSSIDDEDRYWKSLHLSADINGIKDNRLNYINIPGSDKPGDMPNDGVQYVHIEPVATLANATYVSPNAVYWDKSTGKYMENKGSGWTEVDAARMNQILSDKAYIDKPNMDFLTFLNPRMIYYGLKLSIEL